jgi:hypothetical protein
LLSEYSSAEDEEIESSSRADETVDAAVAEAGAGAAMSAHTSAVEIASLSCNAMGAGPSQRSV